MAAPVAVVAKAAAAVLSNEKTRKAAGWVIAAVLSPVIVIVAAIGGALSGAARHNMDAVSMTFGADPIPASVPADYRARIEETREEFAAIDGVIAGLEAQMDAGNKLDATRIKAIFYALYFAGDAPNPDAAAFVSCFVTWEERAQNAVAEEEFGTEDEDGTPEEDETYSVPIPVTDLSAVYAAIETRLNCAVSPEDKANAAEVYRHVLYGGAIPVYGPDFDCWLSGLNLSDAPFLGIDGFCSPLGAGWQALVTSEFGGRKDPFTGAYSGHTGIDLASPKGTPIRAALGGTVYFVRYSATGYGYHLMIDHGGGFVTLYGHCSKILVAEGQRVEAGDVIAEVGSTGRSTGNHLHFEVIVNGEKRNPRGYLP